MGWECVWVCYFALICNSNLLSFCFSFFVLLLVFTIYFGFAVLVLPDGLVCLT